jgi:hypothetical protein
MSRTQIRITIGLLLLMHVSLAVLLTPIGLPAPNDHSAAHRVGLMVIGALVAQPGLLAICAALGPQAFVRRILQALAALVCVYLGVDFAAVQNSGDMSEPGAIMRPFSWFISFVAVQLPLWLLRARFHWQVWPPATLAVGAEQHGNQFSVRGLLTAIALVAATFAALRWLHPASGDISNVGTHLLRFAAIGGVMCLLGLLAIAVCWLVLVPGRRRLRWTLGIASACSLAGVADAVALYGSPGEVWELVFALLGTLLCATGSLLVIRLCGYRLLRRPGGGTQPSELAGTALGPLSHRRFAFVVSSMAVLLAGLAAMAPARLHLWREKAEERRWRAAGLYVSMDEGRIVSVSTNDGAQHAVNADAVDRINLCHDLTRLDLAGSTADDETLERLSALPNLRSLSLTATRISDKGLRQLQKLTKLNDLGLRMTDVSDEGLRVLATLNQGTGIDLGNTRVTPQGIKWLKQLRPDLRIIDRTDDFALRQLSSHFRPRRGAISQPADWRPVALRMHAIGSGVTDAGVAALRGMTNIEEFDLTDARVTDAAINDLATLSGLKKLVVIGTQVSDSGVARLRLALPKCTITH